MFAKNIYLPTVFILSIFVFFIIETGTSVVGVRSKIKRAEITFCGNADCSDGNKEIKKVEAISENFKCHNIHYLLGNTLTRIKIVSGPSFARCIMLYHTNNCTGESLTIKGPDFDTNLKSDAKKNEFLGKNVSSYEFCKFHRLRHQKIGNWTGQLKHLVRLVQRFIRDLQYYSFLFMDMKK